MHPTIGHKSHGVKASEHEALCRHGSLLSSNALRGAQLANKLSPIAAECLTPWLNIKTPFSVCYGVFCLTPLGCCSHSLVHPVAPGARICIVTTHLFCFFFPCLGALTSTQFYRGRCALTMLRLLHAVQDRCRCDLPSAKQRD